MKLSNDFRNMYVLGLVCLLLMGLSASYIEIPYIYYISGFALFLMPGWVYFSKNVLGIWGGLKISALFGFTVTPVYLILQVLISLINIDVLTGQSAAVKFDGAGDLTVLLVFLALSGLVLTASALTSWLIVTKRN